MSKNFIIRHEEFLTEIQLGQHIKSGYKSGLKEKI